MLPNLEKKAEPEKSQTIVEELKKTKAQLITMWKQIQPLSPKQFDKPYSINTNTITTLLSEMKDKDEAERFRTTYNPYYLTPEQHKDLSIVLSLMIQMVDDIDDGFKDPRPANRSPEWKPLQYREDVCYLRVDFQEYKEQWLTTHVDIPIHMENHARIMGKASREQKKEAVISKIAPGVERAKSLIDKIIHPFIDAYSNVTNASPHCVQRFCNKLAPSSPNACCIDARTRMAFDYGLSADVKTETFTDILAETVAKCSKKDSYFYLLATLMKYHWGKKFKKDTGNFGICKREGILNVDAHQLIMDGFNIVRQPEITDDFLQAYRILPQALLPDFIRLVMKQADVFKTFEVTGINEDNFADLMDEEFNDKSLPHFIATDCQAENIAKKFIAYANMSTLEHMRDIWKEPLFTKLIKNLEDKNRSAVIQLCHFYYRNGKIENIVDNLSECMDQLTNAQLIEFVHYTKLLKFANGFNKGYLEPILSQLQTRLNANQLMNLIVRADILRHTNTRGDKESTIESILPILKEAKPNPIDNSQLAYDLLMRSRGIPDHIPINLFGYIINHHDEEADAYLSRVSPRLIPIVLQGAGIIRSKSNLLAVILEKVKFNNSLELFGFLQKHNPYLYSITKENLEKTSLLLAKKLSSEQIMTLIKDSTIITEIAKQPIQELEEAIIILNKIVSSSQICTLLDLNLLEKIFNKTIDETEERRIARINRLFPIVLPNGNELKENKSAIEIINKVKVDVINPVDQKAITTNVMGYLLINDKTDDHTIILSFINKISPSLLFAMLQGKGFYNIPIPFMIYEKIIDHLEPNNIREFHENHKVSEASSNEEYSLLLFKMLNKIPEVDVKDFLAHVDMTKIKKILNDTVLYQKSMNTIEDPFKKRLISNILDQLVPKTESLAGSPSRSGIFKPEQKIESKVSDNSQANFQKLPETRKVSLLNKELSETMILSKDFLNAQKTYLKENANLWKNTTADKYLASLLEISTLIPDKFIYMKEMFHLLVMNFKIKCNDFYINDDFKTFIISKASYSQTLAAAYLASEDNPRLRSLLLKFICSANIHINIALTIQSIYDHLYPEESLATLQNPKIVNKLNKSMIGFYACKNSQTAKYALMNPQLSQYLASYDLEKIACTYEEFALYILKTPEFRTKLLNYHISNIAKAQSVAAIYILQDLDLVSRLYTIDLWDIAKQHEDAAMYILKTPELSRRFECNILLDIAKNHIAAAKYIYSDPVLMSKIKIHEQEAELTILLSEHAKQGSSAESFSLRKG